jgi:hypothetical protein
MIDDRTIGLPLVQQIIYVNEKKNKAPNAFLRFIIISITYIFSSYIQVQVQVQPSTRTRRRQGWTILYCNTSDSKKGVDATSLCDCALIRTFGS